MKEKKREDISNHGVVGILVIVILVSLVSIGSYLKALDGAVPVVEKGDHVAKISLEVARSHLPQITESSTTIGVSVVEPKNTQKRLN